MEKIKKMLTYVAVFNKRFLKKPGFIAMLLLVPCLVLALNMASAGESGMVTIALASLIIGETLVGKRTLVRRVLGVVFGSCLYRFIVAVALRFNVPAAAMKLVSALIVAVAISMPAIRAKFAFEQRKHNARKEVR